ncbi:[FeFe] hydrogenase, group A [Peptoniphilus indolicus]|uniref:Ferredoxin hydrogenase n=2 Tax=Peptoniphilus indolicus TaxID=33030 RepID=G4D3Y5_9FIRM|nr:[FeFe] hydrogenase, group A [Peptoniphilus indolicus]EGY79763.1 ferredoxin hydrogenase [Peptoniphilus indolicus ATCC 29427]SUB75811.1 Iron hydrogenase 1 [Peptoniphilus indolicus]
MVNLTIDNVKIEVAEGTTIMQAAKSKGIEIPHLCYLKDLNEIAACRVCVVEVEGKGKLITACNNVVEEDMVIFTNSPKVMLDRMRTVQMILSQHDCKCATCVRSGNCSLQKLSNDLNIQDVLYEENLEHQAWDNSFPLIRDSKKCIKCMRCIQVCDKMQSLNIWELEGTGARTTVNISGSRTIAESDCSLCGQCITHCPVGALKERDDTSKLWEAIASEDKVVVVQVAPAVRTSWGEEIGLEIKEATVNKIFDALKKIGVDYVFDTAYSADLTIMEEANEFLDRFNNNELDERPMFTSCCPGWLRFIKGQFPHLVPQLSTAKSPMQMFGSVMKTYFAEKIGKKPENIYSVAVMPCLAKKGESEMELFYEEYAGHDTDCVITTRELVRMLRAAHINSNTLEDIEPDKLFEKSSGAGVIFGATGGVMEAALRTAYYTIMGENCSPDAFEVVRAESQDTGVSEASFNLNGVELRVAAVNGLGNARKLIEEIERGEKKYDFVEVMACPGGCVGGGGQPIHDGDELAFERGKNLYFLDKKSELRYSHENEDVKSLYENYFDKPNSHKAHMLLHTDHNSWEMPRSPKRDRNGYVINGF